MGWIDPDGKRKSKSLRSHSMAEKYARRIEGQLAAGTYCTAARRQWKDFWAEYEKRILPRQSVRTQVLTKKAANHFVRIVKPAKVSALRTGDIDKYTSVRRTEKGQKKESTVSVCTVNKELRHIKAVLRVAHDWNYLPQVPKVRMLREPEKLPQYVTAEHFADIYKACKVARFPKNMPYKTEDWWKALLVFCYMTGWRISEVLALRREDLDMDAATALTRHGDNKGKSDARVALHSVVIEHLTKIKSFEPVIFPWYHGEPVLWRQFTKIQEEAGIHLDCSEEHEHTPACHVYGFHDLRRAFASQNAPSLSAEALRVLMRHKSYQTTQRYINIAAKINEAVEKLHVPACLAKAE